MVFLSVLLAEPMYIILNRYIPAVGNMMYMNSPEVLKYVLFCVTGVSDNCKYKYSNSKIMQVFLSVLLAEHMYIMLNMYIPVVGNIMYMEG